MSDCPTPTKSRYATREGAEQARRRVDLRAGLQLAASDGQLAGVPASVGHGEQAVVLSAAVWAAAVREAVAREKRALALATPGEA